MNPQNHLQSIQGRLSKLVSLDYVTADAIKRDIRSYIERIYSSSSHYMNDVDKIRFDPSAGIHVSRPISNDDAFETGKNQCSSLIDSLRRDLKHVPKTHGAITFDDSTTLPQLFRAIPLKLWIIYISSVTAAFLAGVAVARTSFITDLIK
jgi:hypothetical protein